MPAADIEILNSRMHVERLFLEAMRIGLDRLARDPDGPITAQKIIALFNATADWWVDLEPIKLLIEQEGIASGEVELTQQAETLVTAFRDAGLVDIKVPRPRLLAQGREVIFGNFLSQPKRS